MFDPTTRLNHHIVKIRPSGIRRFFDMLDEMKDVVALTVGQPDFVTPWHIRDAGIRSLEEGKTYYTSNNGLLEMRQEIAAYQKRRFALEYDPKTEIIVTVGGSEAIDLAIRATVNPGDEIIVPEPCFVCYAPLVELAGGTPVPLPLKQENNFKLTAEELKSAITPRTKALVLAFPNNPTGACMTREELETLAEVLRETEVLVFSDEIYAELTYDYKHTSIASLPGMRERTVVIGGFSKAYAMTGWRLGYTLAPAVLTKQMAKIHQYGIMCAPTTSQYAAIEALRNGDEDIERMKAEYKARRNLIVERLRAIGLPCFLPEGAFYAFPYIGGFGLSSEEFCEKLLYEKHVAIVPGDAFGSCGEGFARLSYAYSVRHIEQAITRIGEFLKTL
ncbi:MAG: aminotransferase class I/II-fold pyridoxal phosphate-dependent enzyme [Oscillospiraceae bacterium]|nr:aminotransferase class I/II-fold pyridoxal phosphate-dependent enzyme [Oscillospiraceae bacterium]